MRCEPECQGAACGLVGLGALEKRPSPNLFTKCVYPVLVGAKLLAAGPLPSALQPPRRKPHSSPVRPVTEGARRSGKGRRQGLCQASRREGGWPGTAGASSLLQRRRPQRAGIERFSTFQVTPGGPWFILLDL